MPAFAVDLHPEKKRIIDELILGRPVRNIADSVVPRLPFSVIQRYKTIVIKPMLARLQAQGESYLNGEPTTVERFNPVTADLATARNTAQSIMDAPQASIFRQRLEALHGRIDRNLDRAEASPALFASVPALLGQAHKNVEMLGRATGELEQSAGSGVSIQIVCPWAADRDNMPRVSFASDSGTGFDAADLFESVKITPTA
jgi:hypothetical protein